MADRIAVMNEGVLQQFGTPQEIYENPVNSWVATFVGEPQMSLMEMSMTSEHGAAALLFAGETISLDDKSSSRLKRSGILDFLVGVRPDKASVTLDETPDAIKAEVYSRQLLGADVLVEVSIGKTRVRAKVDTSFMGNVGETCYLSFSSENLYYFNAEDGKVIERE